jgi:uncharacterized membrane protein
MNYRGSSLSVPERIFAALPYTISLMAGIPAIELLANFLPNVPIVPILELLRFIQMSLTRSLGFLAPFANLIIFFGLFFFVVRNNDIKQFIRFHTMQSLMIGIAVSVTGLIGNLLGPTMGMFSALLSLIVSAGVVGVSIYSMILALMGNYTNIPLLSEASDAQTRY